MGKSNKVVTKKLWIPVYGITVWLLVGGDSKRFRKKSIEVFGKVADEWTYDSYASCAWTSNKSIYILWFSELPMPCVITHETQHLTRRIMLLVGIVETCEGNHEAWAYLHEYLCKVVIQAIYGKRAKLILDY